MGGKTSTGGVSGFFSRLTGGTGKSLLTKNWNTAMTSMLNGDSRDSIIKAAQKSSNYNDFLQQSGLAEKQAQYKAAYDAAPTKAYSKSTGKEINTSSNINGLSRTRYWNEDIGRAYDPDDIEYRKDLSGISDDLKNAHTLATNIADAGTDWLNNAKNEYGTILENANAGAVTASRSQAGNNTSADASSNTISSNNRRQGGDQIIGDSSRPTDNFGGETLLGANGQGSLKEKETLF